MKAYFIDPFTKTVSEVDLATHTEHDEALGSGPVIELKAFYQTMGCTLVDKVSLDNQHNAVFVDDEGLLKPVGEQAMFIIIDSTGKPHVLAGKALVVGGDQFGFNREPTLSIQLMHLIVMFPEDAKDNELLHLTQLNQDVQIIDLDNESINLFNTVQLAALNSGGVKAS